MLRWYESDLGRYVLARELDWFDYVSSDLFGFIALQMGECDTDFLRANRMPHHFCAGFDAGPLRAAPEMLPIASQSLDLLALPHVLEFSSHPHQVLREAERVLRPEGRLLISGFNPMSLWGLRRVVAARMSCNQPTHPWHGRFIHLTRIKDWLALMGFEVAGGRMACYAPPLDRAAWLDRFGFLEAAGDRWWALGGGVYLIHAVKRVHGMRILLPKRDSPWRARPAWAQPTRTSSQKIGHEQNTPGK
jgi:SAM-dependent methyltransferase